MADRQIRCAHVRYFRVFLVVQSAQILSLWIPSPWFCITQPFFLAKIYNFHVHTYLTGIWIWTVENLGSSHHASVVRDQGHQRIPFFCNPISYQTRKSENSNENIMHDVGQLSYNSSSSIASQDLESNKKTYLIFKKVSFLFCKFPTDYICKLNLAVHDLGVPASESQNLGAFWCVLSTPFGALFCLAI